MARSSFSILHVSNVSIVPLLDESEDCVMTGMETLNVLTCNIDGEPLFGEVLLAAAQRQRHSHWTSASTDKEDKMLCEVWLHIERILFVVPGKREGHFGRGSGYITMNIGNPCQKT
jgi:hypothetical protein